MRLPNQFNIMLVKDKKPLASWKHLTDQRQPWLDRENILKVGAPGTIGIITGFVSNLFVLDIDGPEGEKALEGKFIPRTCTVRTPKGRHIYFRWDSRLEGCITTKAGLLEKVDTRGDGGYVVFYGWEQGPHTHTLATPPQWLIDLLPKKEGRQVGGGVATTLGNIQPGNRNQSFASAAGSLRSRGYSAEEIYTFLEPKAKEVAFPLEELRSVCTSIGRYPAGASVSESGREKGESVETFLSEQTPVRWICKPFIAEQSIGIIGGLPESRKSWVMVDLAVECARGGGLWLNKFPVEATKVLLIDQERSKSEVQRRLQAVIAGKGLAAKDIRSTLFVRSGTSTRIDLQHSFDALRKEISDLQPGLILVDSFATFHTKEESNRMEIQQVMERIKALRNEFGCAIILIHHYTKMAHQEQREGRATTYLDLAGNVAIPAAAETCFGVVKHDDESSFVHHTKSTIGTKAAPFMVKVQDVEPYGSKIVVQAF